MKKKPLFWAILFASIVLLSSNHITGQERIETIVGKKFYLVESKWLFFSEAGDSIFFDPSHIIGRVCDLQKAAKYFNEPLFIRDLEIIRGPVYDNFFVFKVKDVESAFKVKESLINSSVFDYVRFNHYGQFYSSVPNDPRFIQQWNLNRIHFPAAWGLTKGTNNIKIAIIDSGAKTTHEDLSGSILHNLSRNFLFSPPTTDVTDTGGNDGRGHGTQVAGIAGAQTNNNIGIAGVAGKWGNVGARMMILKVGNDSMVVTALALAIDYAVDAGASVINLSAGYRDDHLYMRAAVDRAVNKGVVFIAAVGNNNSSISYPAIYNNTIAVGATLQVNDQRWLDSPTRGSNKGPELDLMAPSGVSTTTASSDPNYIYTTDFGGTSAAAPHVSGTVALMKSVDPGLTPSQIRTILQMTADKTPGMGSNFRTNEYGYGRLNAYKAVSIAKDGFTIDGPSKICATNTTFTLNHVSNNNPITWSFSPGNLVVTSTGTGPTAVLRGNCSSIGKGTLTFTINGSIQVRKFNIQVNGPHTELKVLFPSGQQAPNPYGNFWELCAHTSYELYLINNSSCPTTNYNWTIPSGWTKYYQINNSISINTNSTPQGTVILKGQTCCCPNIELATAYTSQSSQCYYYLIYPNPASSYVEINLDSEKNIIDLSNSDTDHYLTVADQMGTIKHTDQFRNFPYRLSTTNLPNGIYLIRISYKGSTCSKKLVIEH